jgi:hypothetical protein
MHRYVYLLVALALGGLPGLAGAVPMTWDIDQAASSLTLNVPDQNVTLEGTTVQIRLRNATSTTTWNQGRTAAVDGTLSTDYVDGVSIQFLAGQHNAFGLTSGSFRPNPAAFNPLNTNADNPNGQFTDTTTAPAVYAARVRGAALGGLVQFDIGFVSFLDVFYDISSLVLPINLSGNFAGNALTMGVDSATIAFDGLVVSLIGSQPVADSPGAVFGPYLGTNTLAGATVTSPNPIGDPLLRRLSIPVDLPLSLVLEGVPLSASATGTIVAYGYVPLPEPATLALLGGGLVALAVRRRSRA